MHESHPMNSVIYVLQVVANRATFKIIKSSTIKRAPNFPAQDQNWYARHWDQMKRWGEMQTPTSSGWKLIQYFKLTMAIINCLYRDEKDTDCMGEGCEISSGVGRGGKGKHLSLKMSKFSIKLSDISTYWKLLIPTSTPSLWLQF